MPFETFTSNLESDAIRYETLAGRDYMVAPMVMLTEGVHEGTNGPLFYPKEVLGRVPQAWNHKPVCVYHPQNGASATDPDFVNNSGVGLVMNSRFDGKLRAEAWVEKSRSEAVDKRVGEAFKNRSVMEVSTGLWTEIRKEKGTWNGQVYDAVVTNMIPDHLALLPDRKGACSVEKGAGLFQLNEANIKVLMNSPDSLKAGLLNVLMNHGGVKHLQNELSFSAIQSALRETLASKVGDWEGWLEDVFDTYFVYYDDGKLMRQKYIATDSEVSFVDSPEQVRRTTEYHVIGGTNNQNRQEDNSMAKKELVDGLIANNATSWEEKDRETLMSFNEEQLKKMEPIAPPPSTTPNANKLAGNASQEEIDAATKRGAEGVQQTSNQQAPPEPKKPATLKEALEILPPEMREVMNSALTNMSKTKQQYITAITANANNKFSKEQLEGMSVDMLESMAALAGGDAGVSPERQATNYFGFGMPLAPVGNQQQPKEEPLVPPTFNFEAKKEKAGAA